MLLLVLSVVSAIGSAIEDFELDISSLTDEDFSTTTELPRIVDWCSWFDDADLRIRSLQISINADEARIQLYRVPLEIAQRVWNVSAASDAALSPSGHRFVDRVTEGTLKWIRLHDAAQEEVERFLYRGFDNLRTIVDADMVNAIVREYTAAVIADRRRLEHTIISDTHEREDLIRIVRGNAGPIRAELEARIKLFLSAQSDRRLKLDRMDRLVSRRVELRRILVERMEQTSESSASETSQAALRVDCIKSVKRIVFSENRGILTHLRSHLRTIARKHRHRNSTAVCPVYLQAFDDFERYLVRSHEPIRMNLEREIRDIQRIIDESRGTITALLAYNP
jgi:hypothetical protein